MRVPDQVRSAFVAASGVVVVIAGLVAGRFGPEWMGSAESPAPSTPPPVASVPRHRVPSGTPGCPTGCEELDPEVWRSVLPMLAQEARRRGERLRLPFLDHFDPRFHPESVATTVDAWAEDCLPPDAFLNLRCDEYPCIVAFEPPADTGCLDTLGATRVVQVEGELTFRGEELHTPPLFVGTFRDPSDRDSFGRAARRQELLLRSLAIHPWADRTLPDESAEFEAEGMAGFWAVPVHVYSDAFRR